MDIKNESRANFEKIFFGHSAFQYLYAGVELGVFEIIHARESSEASLVSCLGIEHDAAECVIRGLEALDLIYRRDGIVYNSTYVESIFESGFWGVLVDWIRFEAKIVYPGQAYFLESVRTNSNYGLQSFPGEGETVYPRISNDPELANIFYRYMSAWSRVACEFLLAECSFEKETSILDVGGGDATISIQICQAEPTLEVHLNDLPKICQMAQEKIDSANLSNQIFLLPGDFFEDSWAGPYDYILFAHQLVIWSPGQNIALLKKAYSALRPGGTVLILSSIVSNSETEPFAAVMDTVYFRSIPAGQGKIYCWEDYSSWLKTAGFGSINMIRSHGPTPHGLISATKLG